ncbi:hypothetical protein Bca4012_044286 [Brassica carinata]
MCLILTNRSLRSSLIVCSSALGRSTSLLQWKVMCFLDLRVSTSPVFGSQAEDEHEMRARTIYYTNIDTKVTQTDIKLLFEAACGEVYRLRLLGDYHHPQLESVSMSLSWLKVQ